MRYITALIIGLTIWVIGLAPVWGEEVSAPEFPFSTLQDVVDQIGPSPDVMMCEGDTLLIVYEVKEWVIFSDHERKFVGAYYPPKSNHPGFPSHVYFGHIVEDNLFLSITAPFDHDKHITPCQWWAEVPA